MTVVSESRYVHDALFYDSTESLVQTAMPFLSDGIGAGDDVILVCGEENNAALRKALGHDAQVSVLPREEVYRRAPSAVESYRRLMRRRVADGVGRVRLVAEVDFGRVSSQWQEWGRFEAVCNVVLDPYPLWSICAYDTTALSADVLAVGERTHPYVRRGDRRSRNGRFLDPAEFMALSAANTTRGPAPSDPVLSLPDVTDLPIAREVVRDALSGIPSAQTWQDDFLLAINEVITNAVAHGRPPVGVELWATEDGAVCDVTDRGPGFADPFAGYHAPEGVEGARACLGLWMARQLSDELTTSRSARGFTVRLVLNDRSSGRRRLPL
ncbi:MAG: anti-sigma factor RsbA family regulatory protein [Nocardioidaceae bacterium]